MTDHRADRDRFERATQDGIDAVLGDLDRLAAEDPSRTLADVLTPAQLAALEDDLVLRSLLREERGDA